MKSMFKSWRRSAELKGDQAAAPQQARRVVVSPAAPAADQFQSPLFRLPAEIRAIVWGYAVGREEVHVEHNPTRRCHEPLPEAPPAPTAWMLLHREERLACGQNWAEKPFLRHMDWHFTSAVCGSDAGLPPDGQSVRKERLISPLLSCRKAYREAFPLLYTTNTFHFASPRDFLCFAAALPPALDNPLRRIHMRLPFGPAAARQHADGFAGDIEPAGTWAAACRALLQLRQLEAARFTVWDRVQPHHHARPDFFAELVAGALGLLNGLDVQGPLEVETGGADAAKLQELLMDRASPFEVCAFVPWLDSCFAYCPS